MFKKKMKKDNQIKIKWHTNLNERTIP
jgi:hypothetical protein